PNLPSPTSLASIGTISPVNVRAVAAENWNVLMARVASTRAVLMGLAASRAMVVAKSSRRSARSDAARSRISARRRAAGHGTDDRPVVRALDLDGLAGAVPLAGEGNRTLLDAVAHVAHPSRSG